MRSATPPEVLSERGDPPRAGSFGGTSPEAVLERRTRILYAQSQPGVYANPVVAGLLAWVLWPETDPGLLLGWLAGISIVAGARALLLHGFDRAAAVGPALAGWRNAFLAIAVANGAAWGIGGPLLASQAGEQSQYVVLITLSGIAVSAMATMGALLRVYLAFLASVMAPITIWMIAGGGEAGLALGSMVCVAVVCVASAAHQYARGIERSVRHALENDHLVQRLDTASALAETASRELGLETERCRDAERHAAAHEGRNAATVGAVREALVFTDAAGSITAMNAAAEEMSGWTRPEAVGFGFRSIFDLLDPGTFGSAGDPVQDCLRTGQPQRSENDRLVVHRESHAVTTVEVSVVPVRPGRGSLAGTVVALRDVTRMRSLERRIVFQESHDPTTGLINRAEFSQRVARTAAEGAGDDMLLLLEVEGYKAAYLHGGPEAGERLLRSVAETLDGSLHEADTLARVGVDDFAVLLRDCPAERAAAVGAELRAAVRTVAVDSGDRTFGADLSWGAASVAAGDANRLLADALGEARRMREKRR